MNFKTLVNCFINLWNLNFISKRFILCLLVIFNFLISILNSSAQSSIVLTKDTLGAPFQCISTTDNTPFYPLKIERNLDQIQWYNIMQNDRKEYLATSTIGSPSTPIIYDPSYKSGFVLSHKNYEPYILTKSNTRYYETNKPFIDLDLLFGANATNMVNLRHSQNISKHDNYGIHYQRVSATGAFQNANTLLNSTSFYNIFYNKKYNYRNQVDFILNDIKVQENGGLKKLYEANSDKKYNNVNLSKASNTYYQIEYHWMNEVFLQKIDSNNTNKNSRTSLYGKLVYKNNQINFKDLDQPDSAFYGEKKPQYFTIDHFGHYHTLGVDLGGKYFLPANKSFFRIEPTLQIHHISVSNFSKKDSTIGFVNTIASISLFDTSNHLQAKLEKGISGYNGSDLMAEIGFKYESIQNINFTIYGKYQSKAVDYFQQNADYNFKQWNHNFKTEKNIVLKASAGFIGQKGYHIFNINFIKSNDKIYIDSTLSFKQDSIGFQTFSVEYKNKISSKFFVWSNDFVFQTHNSSIISIPKLWWKSSLYYQSHWFKQNMNIQIGTDMRYLSVYKAYGYSPLLSSYYIQNTSIEKYNPVFDLFINVNVKALYVTLKMNDLTEGLLNNKTNYNNPLYPQQGRGLDVFIAWRFLN